MSRRKQGIYPCSIYIDSSTLSGWCVIMRGHNLSPDQIQEQLSKVEPDTCAVLVEEHAFVYVPRIKWCENTGSACDMEGDWHSHWSEVVDRGDPATQFSVVQYEYADAK